MDKDAIILKYDQLRLDDAEAKVQAVEAEKSSQGQDIAELQEKMKLVYAKLGKEPGEVAAPASVKKNNVKPAEIQSYDEIYAEAHEALMARGLDVESLDYHDLVSEAELCEIEMMLNRPLPRKEKWVKADYIAVFIAASIASLADLILSDRNNKFTGKDSDFSKWLNQFHKHDPDAPIDYQGPHFGGGYHRGLSKGHDILRFIEGIMMFKKGEFRAIRYENGKAIEVISKVNQYRKPYEQLSTIEAIVRYAKHMFGDLFSTCSLPFPGSSFLVESDNRQLRKFAADMYQNGFNLKNIIIQSVTAIIIEVIIRIYFSIQSVRQYKASIEIAEDYSNFEAVKRFLKPNTEKLNEMLLIAHSIVTCVNVGKVIITKQPWAINVAEIIAVVKYGGKVMNAAIERNNGHKKLLRNNEDLAQGWDDLLAETERGFITTMEPLRIEVA